jgi:hypothetical protein
MASSTAAADEGGIAARAGPTSPPGSSCMAQWLIATVRSGPPTQPPTQPATHAHASACAHEATGAAGGAAHQLDVLLACQQLRLGNDACRAQGRQRD